MMHYHPMGVKLHAERRGKLFLKWCALPFILKELAPIYILLIRYQLINEMPFKDLRGAKSERMTTLQVDSDESARKTSEFRRIEDSENILFGRR
jgi:hypothetical protein